MNGPRRHPLFALAPLAAAVLLVGCSSSGPKPLPGDNAPTLASLRDRQVEVVVDAPGALATAVEADSIAAYQSFLEAAPGAPQRPEAMRRLGDLEMDRADRVAAEGSSEQPDYKLAIARYEAFLKAYPTDPRVDRVLYQLARAQESSGQLELALATLSRLVKDHPGTLHAEEAHFRRGEMLFATRQWAAAEEAYRTVLGASGAGVGTASGGTRSPFTDRALYMQGWSLFKQGRTEDALEPFFAVLDLKLGDLPPRLRDEARLEDLTPLSRADRELVEDSFRVLSISLAALQGEASIPSRVSSRSRESWQFRVYLALAELYTKQERVKDAADTLAAFVRRQPLHAQAPLMQARVIDIYAGAGFEQLALAAKREHATRYDANSEFRRANPDGWARAQPLVQQHMAELARHHHALAQRARAAAPTAPNPDVTEAVRWYDALLTQFPEHAGARANRFLLAELLYDDRAFARSANEFERVAYTDTGPFDRAADAGYSALLALAELRKATPAAEQQALQRRAVGLSERFASAFPADARGGAVLVNASETLFALATPGPGSVDGEAAVALARQALQRQPAPERELQRVAWTVIAHQAFEAGRLAEAESAYAEVLDRAGSGDTRRAEWTERRAAAVVRQGQAAREAGDWRAAAGHFARVAGIAGLAAGSALRGGAAFDHATALIEVKDWPAAAGALEAFRREHPAHALQKEVPPRLALAYLELGRHSLAAREFETIATTATEPALARSALWQAAELHEKAALAAPVVAAAPVPAARPAPARRGAAASRAAPTPAAPPSLQAIAMAAWERYVQAHPQPLEPAVDARWRLAELNKADAARRTTWLRAVQQADAAGGDARTPRTRRWGGLATLALAEPQETAYQQVKLVEPLQRQLKAKKQRMDDLLKAYAAASEAGVAEVTTAATYRTAALYADFGQALIKSERPKKLSKLEREQYDVLLEEQAFPFEEKAIELHEANARRTATGVWDEWVRQSLQALAKFKPVRYAKPERADPAYALELAPLQTAVAEARARRAEPPPALLNALGVALRREGRFDDARLAYEEALALDAQAPLPHLNLAILHDLFLGDAPRAQVLYQRYAELVPGEAPQVNRWLAELKARKPAPGEAAPAPTPTAQPAATAATAAAPTETKR
jgi:outer membrane protein assembly factor BamD (BamD/ComL family)